MGDQLFQLLQLFQKHNFHHAQEQQPAVVNAANQTRRFSKNWAMAISKAVFRGGAAVVLKSKLNEE